MEAAPPGNYKLHCDSHIIPSIPIKVPPRFITKTLSHSSLNFIVHFIIDHYYHFHYFHTRRTFGNEELLFVVHNGVAIMSKTIKVREILCPLSRSIIIYKISLISDVKSIVYFICGCLLQQQTIKAESE